MAYQTDVIPLSEAHEHLHVDARKFREWMREANIKSFTLGHGDRRHFLLREDVNRIATSHGIMQAVIPGQAVDLVLNRYGPFDTYATMLVKIAYGYAESNLLSGVHVLLAALQQTGVEHALRAADGLRDLAQAFQHPGLIGMLLAWLSSPSEHAEQNAQYTLGLETALTQARQDAGHGEIAWYNLLRSILQHDRDVNAAIVAAPNFTSSSNSMPYDSHNSFAPELAIEYAPVRWEPTPYLRYKERHHSPMLNLLRQMSERGSGQLVLVRGMEGSPFSRVVEVLTDIFADAKLRSLYPALSGVERVLSQDVGQLHAAGVDRVETAVAVLSHSINQARQLHAILVLKRGELLTSGDEHVNAHLLGKLATIGNVPIILCIEDVDEAAFARPIALQYISYRSVKMKPYDVENTRNALPKYYESLWRERGIVVNSDALESAYMLECALYSESSDGIVRRKVLPYSAADLVQDAVELIRRELTSPGTLRAAALTAAENLEDLLNDRTQGRMLFSAVEALGQIIDQGGDDQDFIAETRPLHKNWSQRCELLESTVTSLRELAEDCAIQKTAEGFYIVTREHVNAELFSSAACQFHLMEAFSHSLDDCDPRGC